MARLITVVLGSAAGGGYPQWNCRCPVCRLAWDGDPRVVARTQAGIAITADGERWTLLNAAPDLRAQIAATPALHPRGEKRGSPIAAVVLTGGEIDQVAGLLNLRERQPFALYGTGATLALLEANAVFSALAHDVVQRRPIAVDTSFALPGGIEAEVFAIAGKVPLYMEAGADDLAATPGGNVGVEIRAGGARLVFAPGVAALDEETRNRLARADAILFDGTLFADDEMIRLGVGAKSGRRMGHMPISGPEGSLAALKALANRRIYIHLNNTNPVLVEGSPERREVEAAGWEVARDGLRIEL